MSIFQQTSQISLDYRGSALARTVGDFTGDGRLEILFSGPRYNTGFVDEAQPFKLLGVSAAGQLTDLSSSLPAGMAAVHARELLSADFNKDGKADAFSANHGFDTPTFPGEAGIDRVTDFSLAEGDRVQHNPGTQYTVTQVGADTVINMTGGGQMILVGVQMNTLTGDWIFGA